jgi:RNA polymerase sigma factor (sigma-70 family)
VDANLDDSERRRWERLCVSRVTRGDAQAFGELYDAYSERLYRRVLYPMLGNKAATEDALAETFRAAFQRLPSYVPGDVSIYHWLAAIGRNKALDMHRARKVTGRALANFEALLEPLAPAPPSPEELFDRESQRLLLGRAVQDTLGQINARYRAAIALRFLEDRPREECASRLGVKLGTFDVLLLRALRAFRKRWEELQLEGTVSAEMEAR